MGGWFLRVGCGWDVEVDCITLVAPYHCLT